MHNRLALLPLFIASFLGGGALGFTAPRTSLTPTSAAAAVRASGTVVSPASATRRSNDVPTVGTALHAEGGDDSSAAAAADPNEVIARRIVVTGDVDGGYYRSCVKNEASRFRKLIGNMSSPQGDKRAEIYVEGKRKMVDGFVRWCERGDVGMSQAIKVDSVNEEDPTGLLDDFYVQTGR
mmetsp:Transcript_34316/g.73141  ORF Transcript_34316/g.73141 Transcript_34316/m.73141 type:complete len:180 (+) Transcript_34316:103-642(+)|eukprot:CAMPEP_0172540296 /NCGR_PEP_ID=MMETSP1067-20121228/11358_1 /TAXON_ID=265564 ORGANISM="Thalassiosira punctigera, Strain Tpunct2005C2" /NCGR_SAMPLE_ID=MMETSP1067 /ASSEMBLY_ACC=CAM_ASM_000444 /LENGTH=179 /DNA_ID=CAMNT_0013326147 /DNA_START=68 /DNA_END=607 /DNA_ORIENTATION=-